MFGFCDYKTIDASDLKDHESKQHEIWHCSKCEYGALDKSLLENHIGIHTGGINFGCGICEFEATRKSILVDHIEMKHRPKEVFKCQVCERKHS